MYAASVLHHKPVQVDTLLAYGLENASMAGFSTILVKLEASLNRRCYP